jgi:hypothetical protein
VIGQLDNDFDAETKLGDNIFQSQNTWSNRNTFFSAILLEFVMWERLHSLTKILALVLQRARGQKDSETEGQIFFCTSVMWGNSQLSVPLLCRTCWSFPIEIKEIVS